jgi:hypothetical protein
MKKKENPSGGKFGCRNFITTPSGIQAYRDRAVPRRASVIDR